MKKSEKGFTLIELMVVIVIIGILVAIALPNFIGAQDRAKLSSVKANMHTFQTMAETYAVDWGGVYPTNVAELKADATVATKNYWKDFVNPFTNNSGVGASYMDSPVSGLPTGAKLGEVLWNREGTTKYFIYGGAKTDNVLIQDKGSNFVLSNS